MPNAEDLDSPLIVHGRHHAGSTSIGAAPDPVPSNWTQFRSAAIKYGGACVVVLLSTLLRMALQPVLKDTAQFAFYFFAVLFIASYLGLGPALFTVVLSAVAGDYFLLKPTHSFLIADSFDKRNLVAFLVTSTVVALICDAQRKSRVRAQDAIRTAKDELAQRRHAENLLLEQQEEIEALNVRLKRAMAETHHRVKNNLQVISSIVDLQTADAGETVPTDALRRVGQHVQSLAIVHDIMTRAVREDGDSELFDTRAVLAELRPLLERLIGNRRLRFTIQELQLPFNQETNLAVLINELVSNAVKHGEGEIEIALKIEAGRGQLMVRDHGPGFPAGFDPRSAAHTGLDLVESLSTWDLGGDLTFQNHPEGGALITVTFPIGPTVIRSIAPALEVSPDPPAASAKPIAAGAGNIPHDTDADPTSDR